jgi:hypothetical protein
VTPDFSRVIHADQNKQVRLDDIWITAEVPKAADTGGWVGFLRGEQISDLATVTSALGEGVYLTR